MIYRYDKPRCLNGWWDIRPIYPEGEGEWQCGKFLVPSCWNKPADALRLPGETYYSAHRDESAAADPEADNLFDTTGYPNEWSRAKSAWVRRNVAVEKRPGKRYILILEAAGPKAVLFINGQQVAEHREYLLPLENDITDFLQDGENELLLLLSDYERNEAGNTLWPSGNGYTSSMFGLWQDVYLLEKNEIYIDDITIITSVRKRELTIRAAVRNCSNTDADIALRSQIAEYSSGATGVAFPEMMCHVAAGETGCVEQTVAWENPKLWDNFNPNLYWLDMTLLCGGVELDTARERFGFREVWVDGHNLMLNDHPVRLFYDWGHKQTCFNYTEGWIRCWFQMMRDYGYNGSRLHTHPHPQIIMELADEYGIFITGETGCHGAGNSQAAGSDAYWDNMRQHVRGFVKRDKNHPSVVLWSCENEMRWNQDGLERTKEELPKIRKLFNELDPTRIAYHDGDSSFWNEKRQDLISRHYGKEVTGFGWWDKSRPLHSGEMSMHHYSGVNCVLHLIGDRGWEDFQRVNAAATLDFLYVAEDARANGVCCLGPWNLSCLVNLREHEEHHFTYDNYEAPGIKPMLARAGASEFEYWSGLEKGYVDQPGCEDFKTGFRPFAVIDLSRRRNYYPEGFRAKTFHIVNDTCAPVSGTLAAEVLRDGAIVKTAQTPINVSRGEIAVVTLDLSDDYESGAYSYRVRAVAQDGTVLDQWSRDIVFGGEYRVRCGETVAVYSDDSIVRLLEETGVHYRMVDSLEDIREQVVVIGRNMVTPESGVNHQIQRLAQEGRRVILLSQQGSPFPSVPLVDLAVQTAHIRAYDTPLLDGISDADVQFWGDDPYSLLSGDTLVAGKLYQKDDGGYMHCLLDAGEGNFGKGNIENSPYFFAQEGKGLVIACQLLIVERFLSIPAAKKLFVNMIDYAFDYVYAPVEEVAVAEAGDYAAAERALDCAKAGGTALLLGLDPTAAKLVHERIGVLPELVEPADGFYGCVHCGQEPILSGISNADLCGIERVNYAQKGAENIPIGRYVIREAEGIRPLAVTAPRSAMISMYVYAGSSELLRAYTLTRSCYHNTEVPDVAIGEIQCGAGRVIVSTLNPPYDKRTRFVRVKNRLIANLTQNQVGESALDGEIPVMPGASEGYPTFQFVYNNPMTEATLQNMLESSIYQTERMNATPILSIGGFERIDVDDDALCAAPYDLKNPIMIYYTLESLVPRKNMGSDLGIPDPAAQTFLDIHGEGQFELWLNGELRGSHTAENGMCTFPDLEVERGYNHILIRWTPQSADSTCKMRWRNILRIPETGFLFTHTKSDV